ncbi:MAG: molybdopterin molybdenumtransferase MoeA, partial [Sciscionella sp.]|nr:molybdopterin molybdenumtransferase MoeA [Sciscionella sp.]
GQIYESNAVLLAAAVRAAGGHAEVLRFVPDDVESLYAAIHPRLSTVDFLITSGGVSAGAYEVVKDAFSGAGVRFYKVAMQPGGPQGAGRYTADGARIPVIALPGNPVSALVSFEVFIRPAIRAALGHRVVERERVRGRLRTGLRSIDGKRQYRRARYHADTGELEPIGGPGGHLLSALAASNCLLEIPENVTELAAGDEITALLLD